jgi:hypothetical protein
MIRGGVDALRKTDRIAALTDARDRLAQQRRRQPPC